MTRWRVGFAVLRALTALGLLLALVAPVSAHVSALPSGARVEPSPPTATAVATAPGPSAVVAASPTAGSWWVVLALTALTLGRRRPRRGLALGLCLALAVFAFASGFHSVHHLGARDPSHQCAIASIAAQAPADLPMPVRFEPTLEPAPRSGAPPGPGAAGCGPAPRRVPDPAWSGAPGRNGRAAEARDRRSPYLGVLRRLGEL